MNLNGKAPLDQIQFLLVGEVGVLSYPDPESFHIRFMSNVGRSFHFDPVGGLDVRRDGAHK